MSTTSEQYTERLQTAEVWWKKALGVQRIYAWNLRRMEPGYMLEIGCGIGRNLRAVAGHGVGVDHNAHSVAHARALGFSAFTSEEFARTERTPERFDSLLVSHVLEHMDEAEAEALVRTYLPLLKRGGQLICITPQERGHASDETHVRFMDFAALSRLIARVGLVQERALSFPFPRPVGKLFTYNEFVVTARKP